MATLVAVALAVTGWGTVAAAEPTPGSISGTVSIEDSEILAGTTFVTLWTGGTVVGAELSQGSTVVTSQEVGADGSYAFTGLELGTYKVEATTTVPGRLPSTSHLQGFFWGGAIELDATTPERPGTDLVLVRSRSVDGVVRLGTGSAAEPVSGARVALHKPGLYAPEMGLPLILLPLLGGTTAVSDEQGRFSLSGVAPGTYSVRVDGTEQWHLATQTDVVVNDASPALELALVPKLPAPRVTGRVTLDTGGDSVADSSLAAAMEKVTVTPYRKDGGDWIAAESTRPDAQGEFGFTLAAGVWKFKYELAEEGYPSEWHRVPDASSPTEVELADGDVVTGIDGRIALRGSLSGTFTPPAGGGGPWTVVAVPVGEGAGRTESARVPVEGRTWSFSALVPGHYALRFSNGIETVYWGGSATLEKASWVSVYALGGAALGDDFNLATGPRRIRVQLNLPDGVSTASLRIAFYRNSELQYYGHEYGIPDTGEVTSAVLPEGSYRIRVFDYDKRLVDTWIGGSGRAEATPFSPAPGRILDIPDFDWPVGATVKGRVSSTDLVQPGTYVGVFSAPGNRDYPDYSASLRADGTYEISGIAPGNYFVATSAYATEWEQLVHGGGTSPGQGTELRLTAGQVVDGIDFRYRRGGVLRGRVGLPAGVDHATVRVHLQHRAEPGREWNDLADPVRVGSGGEWVLTGAAAGDYRIKVSDTGGELVETFVGGTSWGDATIHTLVAEGVLDIEEVAVPRYVAPSPSPSPSVEPAPSPSPSPSVEPLPSPSPEPVPSPSPDPAPSDSPAPSPSASPSASPSTGPSTGPPAVRPPSSAVVLKMRTKPQASGRAKVGRKLTATPGRWVVSGASGKPKVSYQWQVKKGGKAVALKKGKKSSFTLTRALRGKRVRLRVTVTFPGARPLVSATPWSKKVA